MKTSASVTATGFDPAAAGRDLPPGPGAYALVIEVTEPFAMPGFPPLPRGRYLYAGSAHGPGGIRARARRHLNADKTVRWHVDRLTNAFGVALIVAQPGGRECDVLARALALPGACVPAPGFGATDCPTCPAHLVRLPDGVDPAALPAHFGGKV